MILLLFWMAMYLTKRSHINATEHQEQCQYIMSYDYGSGENQHCTSYENIVPKTTKNMSCKKNSQCPMNNRIKKINYMVQVKLLEQQIPDMLMKCCGDCTYTETQVEDINTVLTDDSTLLKSSDIIYPVFGLQTSTRLYGFWFIPFMQVSPGLYILKQKSHENITADIMESITNLWTLIVILVIFALLSGFMIWLFETWTNPENFSQSFAAGLSDGFWLAYISMTTGNTSFVVYTNNNQVLPKPFQDIQNRSKNKQKFDHHHFNSSCTFHSFFQQMIPIKPGCSRILL